MSMIKVFSTATDLADGLIKEILRMIEERSERVLDIAFSGGSTPAVFFERWATAHIDTIPWKRIRFWWVDERCVPPDDPESNYGLMNRLLLSRVPVDPLQVFRIKGENPPEEEALRYSALATEKLRTNNGYPVFDLVLLGVGTDGHTSSIFPGQESLLVSYKPYEVSINPNNGQQRIALTGQPMIHSDRVIFVVTGKKKREVVSRLLSAVDTSPAFYIYIHADRAELFVDRTAHSV